MAIDMASAASGASRASGAQPEASDAWSVEQRGSFVVARCDVCGFTTSARRARFSVEADMLVHAPGCVGPPDVKAADPVASLASAAQTAAAPAMPRSRRSR